MSREISKKIEEMGKIFTLAAKNAMEQKKLYPQCARNKGYYMEKYGKKKGGGGAIINRQILPVNFSISYCFA
ncbi:MAG: hypothetical protein LBC38_04325 [Oscillospiraceae bacterium]|nr:hypothetical protein [Oscillospiraceae bacterium]